MFWAPIIVVISGLVVGSFLNVCIYRIPRGRSIIRPGSYCLHCHSPVRSWENIPLLSFIFLRGRCSHCKQPIGWVYPTVEVLTALLFYLLFLKYGFSHTFFLNGVFFCLLVILIFIDLFERILPNVITLSGLVLGLLTSPFQSPEFFQGDLFWTGGAEPWKQYLHSLLGVVVGGGTLWLVATLYLKLRKVEGMGGGDIKMIAMVGAFLGWRYAFLTIFLGSLLGALAGSLYIYVFRKGRRYELPFGTFLGVGAILSTLWGRDLASWYWHGLSIGVLPLTLVTAKLLSRFPNNPNQDAF